MRRAPAAFGALLLSVSPALVVSSAAYAQAPPTTVGTSIITGTVQRPVTSNVTDTVQHPVATVNTVDTNDSKGDDDSKAGLWGLAGLLGLLGLAGLKRKRDDATTRPTTSASPVTGTAPPRAEGATGRDL